MLKIAAQVTPTYTPLPLLLAVTLAETKVQYPEVTPKRAPTGGNQRPIPVAIPAPPATVDASLANLNP